MKQIPRHLATMLEKYPDVRKRQYLCQGEELVALKDRSTTSRNRTDDRTYRCETEPNDA